MIEHDYLPDVFYNNPERFNGTMIDEQSDFMNFIIETVFTENDAPMIPDYNDFSFNVLADSDELKCVLISENKLQ